MFQLKTNLISAKQTNNALLPLHLENKEKFWKMGEFKRMWLVKNEKYNS